MPSGVHARPNAVLARKAVHRLVLLAVVCDHNNNSRRNDASVSCIYGGWRRTRPSLRRHEHACTRWQTHNGGGLRRCKRTRGLKKERCSGAAHASVGQQSGTSNGSEPNKPSLTVCHLCSTTCTPYLPVQEQLSSRCLSYAATLCSTSSIDPSAPSVTTDFCGTLTCLMCCCRPRRRQRGMEGFRGGSRVRWRGLSSLQHSQRGTVACCDGRSSTTTAWRMNGSR